MLLQLDQLEVGYSKSPSLLLPISTSADAGLLIALVGGNGIGKSTLLKTISGLLPKKSGKIFIEGKELDTLSNKELATKVSVVSTERISIDLITVRDFIALGRFPYTNWIDTMNVTDYKVIEEVLAQLSLTHLAHKQFNQISDGERQKVMLGRALTQQTPLLLLDEPTSFLDYKNRKQTFELLAEITVSMNRLIILSTHDLEFALENCQRFWLINNERNLEVIEKSFGFEEKIKASML